MGKKIEKSIENFFEVYHFDYLDTVATLYCEFISVSKKDIAEQNTDRCEEYCNSFVEAYERGLSNSPPEDFPNYRRMGSYEFDYKFDIERTEKFYSGYEKLLNEIHQAKLIDAENSEKFQTEILLNFSNAGVVKKKLVSELGYKIKYSSRESVNFGMLRSSKYGSWEIIMDRSNTRSPKKLSYFFGLKFDNENSKYLNVDLSLIDYRLAFLNMAPFVGTSNYSKEQCVLMEHYLSFVQLSIFPIIVDEIEKHLNEINLPLAPSYV